MADDKPLKSALELAMERLRKQDAESGVEQHSLTEAQKAAIAEVRTIHQAKVAEAEVLLQSRLRRSMDPAEREAIETELRRERERLAADRDAKIEKIRSGGAV